MALTHILFLCPRCGHDPMEGEKDEAMMTGEEQGPELAPSLDARPVDPNEPSGTQSEP